MPYKTPPEIERRKIAMKAAIKASGKRLFAINGYNSTAIQQIVDDAGTSIGNFYFYFSDKAELLLSIVEEISEEIGEEIDLATEKIEEGPLHLAVAIRTGITALLERVEIARVVLEAKHPAMRATVLGFFSNRLLNVFKQSPKLIGGIDPYLTAYAWQGAIFNVLEGIVNGNLKTDPDKVVPFLIRWNLQALGYSRSVVESVLSQIDTVMINKNRKKEPPKRSKKSTAR